MSDASGVPWHEGVDTIDEVRRSPDALMVMTADFGGQSLLTCPVARVRTDDAPLHRLLVHLGWITWGPAALGPSSDGVTDVRSSMGILARAPHAAAGVGAPLLGGRNPPTHGRIVHAKTHCDPTGPVTDYDRACDVEGLVGVIPVGPHHAIVIGDEVPMSTLVRESSGSLAIVVPMTWEHEDAFDSLETLVRVTDEAAPRRTTGLRYPHPGGPVVLQAAVDGADDPLGGRIVADLDKGEYTIATFDGIVEEGEVRIHVLQRRTP